MAEVQQPININDLSPKQRQDLVEQLTHSTAVDAEKAVSPEKLIQSQAAPTETSTVQPVSEVLNVPVPPAKAVSVEAILENPQSVEEVAIHDVHEDHIMGNKHVSEKDAADVVESMIQ
jgi:hypothetical protein